MPAPGVVLYPKPAGVSSHEVVAAVRQRQPPGVKVGHAGTLDPFATGLLLVLVGAATRAQRWFMALPKTYRVVARLGWRSDTGDPEGRLERTGRVPADPAIPTGELLQRPPAYSAVKVGGERLYRRARRGQAVDAARRPITVHRAELLWRSPERAAFEIECSSGTYVRQLVAELRDAYCESLQRTRVGPFRLDDASPERVVPLADAMSFLPRRELGAADAERVSHGVRLPGAQIDAGAVALFHDGTVLAVAEPRDGGLQPVVVFAAA